MGVCGGEVELIRRGAKGAMVAALAVAAGLLAGCLPTDPGVGPLPVPGGITASQGTYADKVRLSWDPVPEAEGYRLQRAQAEGSPFSTLVNTGNTTYDDTGVTPGDVYWYRVRACGALGARCGVASAAVQGYAEAEEGASDPDLDQDFAATQGTHDDRIVVTWKRVSGATSYRLYRADDVTGPFEEPIATVSGTSYTDSDKAGNRLTLCHSYWYRLEVCTGTGCTFLPSGVEGWRGTRIEGEEIQGLAASDLAHPGMGDGRGHELGDPLAGA
ncbi:MAG: fibronectin type III domain-containing protein, partial [Candidatus Bipolaricaulota bacterium]